MNPVYLRLLEIAEDQGHSAPVPGTYFQELLSLSSGRISQISDPLSVAKIGAKGLTRLANLGYNPDWVNGGPPHRKWLLPSSNTQTQRQGAESNAEEAPALGRAQRIPVVGTAQLGDNGYWAELETPVGFGDGHIEFAAKTSNAYALRCKGDSMKPRIKDGEFVIIEPDHPPIPGDEVLVRAKDGRVMVKELLYVRDDTLHLLSINESHGKLAIPIADIEVIHFVCAIAKRSMWQPD